MVVDLIGKGGRVRAVPMPSWTKQAIDAWIAHSAIDRGFVLRAVNGGGRLIGERMTPRSIFEVVRGAGAGIGIPRRPDGGSTIRRVTSTIGECAADKLRFLVRRAVAA